VNLPVFILYSAYFLIQPKTLGFLS